MTLDRALFYLMLSACGLLVAAAVMLWGDVDGAWAFFLLGSVALGVYVLAILAGIRDEIRKPATDQARETL